MSLDPGPDSDSDSPASPSRVCRAQGSCQTSEAAISRLGSRSAAAAGMPPHVSTVTLIVLLLVVASGWWYQSPYTVTVETCRFSACTQGSGYKSLYRDLYRSHPTAMRLGARA